VIFLCLSLYLSFLPRQVEAQVGRKVQIQIGKPSIWSIGQAHYLLADMRQKNRSLKTRMPDDAALDPNSINATSISILRTLLDIRGEYNQKIALENSQARREESFNLRRRDEARLKLAGKQNERDDLQFRIEDMDRRLARLRKEKQLRDEEREKDTPLTAEDRARELKIVELESTLASHNAEKTRLDTEIAALESTATASVGATSLTSASVPADTAVGKLPGLDSLNDYIKNSIGQVKQPSLSASIALDNYIGMQYEIIAKQLTLLRDELGPDERIIFLELPSTIYTVPGKADDLVVQLRWTAKRYYQSSRQPTRQNRDDGGKSEYEKIEDRLYNLDVAEITGRVEPQQNETGRWVNVNPDVGEGVEYVTSIQDGVATDAPRLRRAAVRALDVIPRQSALNINETYATANQKNFLGVLKLLSGIGLQVNYQRERQLYEQFLQQEIFASGFGKGRDEFGWTFGPQPGTKRVTPGLRTTYAVLAVPRFASALQIEVEGVAYPRKKTPDFGYQIDSGKNQLVTRESFVVRIPNEITEKFWVDEVEYTPVKKGGSVTVQIKGRNFSPQIGVLVNSVPLTRALSLANNESANAASLAANSSGVQGAFELMSSGDIMLTFAMGDAAFVGTPTITLVAPERTESINDLPMDRVNAFWAYADYNPRLRNISWLEPMFNDSLNLKEFVREPLREVTVGDSNRTYSYVQGRLYGTGMLPEADIEIDGRLIPLVDRKFLDDFIDNQRKEEGPAFDRLNALERALMELEKSTPPEHPGEMPGLPREYVYQYSTGEYRIFARVRNKNKFEVRYKHQTVHGFDVATYKYISGDQPQVRRYVAEAETGHSLVDLRIHTTIPEQRLLLSLGSGEQKAKTTPDVKYEGDNNYRAVFVVTDEKLGMKGDKPIMGKRDTITVTVEDNQDHTKQSFDVPLPVQPTITGVVNPSTGKPEGKADEEPVATISGRDLHQVKRVFFGEQEATIVGGPTFDSIEVKVPKRTDVPDGEKITVSVRLVTTANKTSPGSHYTFIGKPKTPQPPQQSPTPPKSG